MNDQRRSLADAARAAAGQSETYHGTSPLRPRVDLPPTAGPVLRPVPRDVPGAPSSSPAPRHSVMASVRRWVPFFRPYRSPAAVVANAAGAVLVVVSVLLLGWGLWENIGSKLVASQGQAARVEEFRELQAAAANDYSWSTTQAPTVDPALGLPEPPAVPAAAPAGRANVVGRLRIPAIDVDEVVAVGTEVSTLNQGPGLWEPGVFPGAPGNATIAGHRNTYGSPFYYLDRLTPGDRIYFEAPGRPVAVFEVRGTAIVEPSEVGVTAQGPGVRLTLTTCTPIGTADKRLIVQGELVEGEFAAFALASDQWAFRR